MPPRVTLKSIAEACNVSVATVSYALRQSSHIPESTRKRIQAVADRLGYRPDPALSSLASRKRRSGNTSFYASVAVLHPNPQNARATKLFNIHAQYFKERMHAMGCSVTDFYLDCRPERLAQILRTRGIRGILLGWGEWPESMQRFPWKEFAVISTERTELGDQIDKVSMNHFRALDDIFLRLDPYQCKRYGLIIHDDCPNNTENHILGAYYANLFERPHLETKIPHYRYHLGESADRLKTWYAQHQPDVIISHRMIDDQLFKDASIQFPKPTRFAVMEIDEALTTRYTGIYTGSNLGYAIATLLARKMRNDEIRTSDRKAKLTLVNGIWHDGETLN